MRSDPEKAFDQVSLLNIYICSSILLLLRQVRYFRWYAPIIFVVVKSIRYGYYYTTRLFITDKKKKKFHLIPFECINTYIPPRGPHTKKKSSTHQAPQ